MKKQHVLISLFLAVGIFALVLNSCKKDEEPSALNLVTIVAGDIDLNGSTAPNNVPVSPTITLTFSTDLKASTVTESTVTMVQDYDDAMIQLTITVSGKTITITPETALGNGTLYQLNLMAGILSAEDQALTAFNRTFTTTGTFVPSGVIAHWSFENNANDVIGSYDPTANGVVAVTYTDSRSTAAGKAATFDGDASIIEVPNGDQLMNTNNFTLSFWVKANSVGHVDANQNPAGHFVIGLGTASGFQFEIPSDYSSCKLAATYQVTGATQGEDLWFNGSGETKDNGGWQGWTFCKNLTQAGGVAGLLKDKWANVICTYNSSTKVGTMYINGEKMKAQDFNLYGNTHPIYTATGLKYSGVAPDVVNELAFGFIQSRAGTKWDAEPWGGYEFPGANHFKGQLDDIRIFHKALTQTEVTLMYNSEKP